MTTGKLIEELRDYAEIFETESKGDEDLKRLAAIITECAKKLEMAYEALKDLSRCSNCGNSKCFVSSRYDTGYCLNGEWEWEGDDE